MNEKSRTNGSGRASDEDVLRQAPPDCGSSGSGAPGEGNPATGPAEMNDEELVEWLAREPRVEPSEQFRRQVMSEIRRRPAHACPAPNRWLALWYWFRKLFK